MTRNKLLQAARQVAVECGVSNLTIEAVAREAGVSKGAVLYHFASKVQLLTALLEALLDGFDQLVVAEVERGKSSWLRAYLRASFPGQRAGYLQETTTIFAIVSLSPELRDVVRTRFEQWHRRAREGAADPVTAHLIRAAIDGLWYNEMFGLSLEPGELKALLAHLETLVGESLTGLLEGEGAEGLGS